MVQRSCCLVPSCQSLWRQLFKSQPRVPDTESSMLSPLMTPRIPRLQCGSHTKLWLVPAVNAGAVTGSTYSAGSVVTGLPERNRPSNAQLSAVATLATLWKEVAQTNLTVSPTVTATSLGTKDSPRSPAPTSTRTSAARVIDTNKSSSSSSMSHVHDVMVLLPVSSTRATPTAVPRVTLCAGKLFRSRCAFEGRVRECRPAVPLVTMDAEDIAPSARSSRGAHAEPHATHSVPCVPHEATTCVMT